MGKPRIANQRKKYQELAKRLQRYVLIVQSIYDTLADDMSKLLGTIDIDYTVPFRFKDYPHVADAVDSLRDEFVKSIRAAIYRGTSDEWKQSNIVQDLIANKILKSYGAQVNGDIYKKYYLTNSDALKAFQERKDRGMGLSEKIWRQSEYVMEQLEKRIATAIQKGTSAVTLSKQVSKYLHDYPSFEKDYKELYGEAKDISDCEYRSIRLARTEINMAYRKAEQERWRQMDFVLGYEIKLSHMHPKYDICDELEGVYPLWFEWEGWHPNCYSDDTFVMTDSGWKLFKDVKYSDLILSLNPKTKGIEYSRILFKQVHEGPGRMVSFKGDLVDALVTPEHRMVFLNGDKIGYCKASEYSYKDGAFMVSMMGANLVCQNIKKSYSPYRGKVYDVTLEKNHIMFVKRNNMTFWGSNCMCYEIPLLMTEDEFWDDPNTERRVQDMPDNFMDWMEKNQDRIEAAKERDTLPYWLKNNPRLIKDN